MPSPGTIYLVELDTKPTLECSFTDPSGDPIDLTDYASITLYMRRPDGTRIARAATIDDALEGQFHFTWQADDLQEGTSDLEIVFVDDVGGIQTIPGQGTMKGVIRGRV